MIWVMAYIWYRYNTTDVCFLSKISESLFDDRYGGVVSPSFPAHHRILC